MPLDTELVSRLVSHPLELQPIYGWGWAPRYPWTALPRAALPPRLTLRLTAIVGDRAGVGRLQFEAGGLGMRWTLFELRREGTFDFDERIGVYDVAFRTERPITPEDHAGVWDDLDLRGFGLVGRPGFRMPW